MPRTNVNDFIAELGAGTFKEKLSYVLSEIANSTINHGDKKRGGKLTIEFSLRKVGDHDQVEISHKIVQTTLTKRGKKTEEDTTESFMFVGKGGEMTIDAPVEDRHGQTNILNLTPEE